LVATNHFADPSWGVPSPVPDENNGWTAKRRNNLINLVIAKKNHFDVEKMMRVMDTTIPQAGARQPAEKICRIIAVPMGLTLWFNAPGKLNARPTGRSY
jgi:hypothetical protein